MKKKNLVIFEINECDFEFFFLGSKKYNYPLIKKFFSKKKKLKLLQEIKKKDSILIHGFSGCLCTLVLNLPNIEFIELVRN